MDQNADFVPAAGITVACPCCGGMSLELFEDTLDIENNIVAVDICLACSALVNRSSLERLLAAPEKLRDLQTKDLANVYPIGRHVHAELEQELGAHRNTLDFFRAQALPGVEPATLTYAEIGIGRGTLIRSAAMLFKKCYAVDLDYALFEATRDHLIVPQNIVLLNAIEHVPEPIDVVVACHSLEHVPRLNDLVSAIRAVLKPGGHLFFQVPLYRPSHLMDCRYVFLNRRAVTVLADIECFEVAGLWTDHARACLTGLLRKPSQDKPSQIKRARRVHP
jgi:SAM-dependent methyltransferase